MGLDIYLYTQAEQAANEAHEKGWEAAYSAHHDPQTGALKPGHTTEMWEAARDAVPPYIGSERMPSEKYPDHLFQKNYLRSSYNDGGFNRAVPDMLGRNEGGLYWIFEPVIGDDPEPYETVLTAEHIGPLELTRGRALAVAEELRASDPLRVMHVNGPMLGGQEHMWDHLPTEDEVLAWYRDEMRKRQEYVAQCAVDDKEAREEYGYMSAKGEVFGFSKGMEILAVTLGANSLASFSSQFPIGTVGGQMGAMPTAMLVYRQGDEGKRSYVESAEIVAEFCDYAVELIKQDGGCTMHWSG